jgi:hypothetical protein
MPITTDEARALDYRDVLVDLRDGARWRVNGKVRTWVRMPTRFRVPLKHGLYAYGYLRDTDFTDGVCEYMTKEN